jgi:hypothetical protein
MVDLFARVSASDALHISKSELLQEMTRKQVAGT